MHMGINNVFNLVFQTCSKDLLVRRNQFYPPTFYSMSLFVNEHPIIDPTHNNRQNESKEDINKVNVILLPSISRNMTDPSLLTQNMVSTGSNRKEHRGGKNRTHLFRTQRRYYPT